MQVQEGYQTILARNAHEILESYYVWKGELRYQMDYSEPYMPEFVVNVLAFTIFELRWLTAEWRRCCATWTPFADQIEYHKGRSHFWLTQQSHAQRRLAAVVDKMKNAQSQPTKNDRIS